MLNKGVQTIKEFFGDNNELVESTNIALKERIYSPFYGYFITAWVFINWKLLYIAFFVGQDNILQKTGLLRYDYLRQFFPNHWSLDFWLNFIAYPLFATIIFFWFLPYVTRIYYRKSIKNQIKLKIIEIQETKKETKEEKELLVEEIKKAKEEKRAEKETPEILWKKEFEEFSKSRLFPSFSMIINSVYESGGYYRSRVPIDILSYADTQNLIKISGDTISLTDKGKYFISSWNNLKNKILDQ